MAKGFYTQEEDGSLRRSNRVSTPDGEFSEGNKDQVPNLTSGLTLLRRLTPTLPADNLLLAFWGGLDCKLNSLFTAWHLKFSLFNGGYRGIAALHSS